MKLADRAVGLDYTRRSVRSVGRLKRRPRRTTRGDATMLMRRCTDDDGQQHRGQHLPNDLPAVAIGATSRHLTKSLLSFVSCFTIKSVDAACQTSSWLIRAFRERTYR